jgi:hypothetical protein
MRAGLLALCGLLGACGAPTHTSGSYSFEGSLQGWNAGAADVTVDEIPLDWSVAATKERSFDGTWSARIFVDNRSEAAKVWLSRTYQLRPLRSYDVHVEFALGTSDPGPAGAFRILAGAEPSIPANGDDAISLARDDTGNGGAAGVAWVLKTYDSIATTGPSGDLTAVVGIWGTFEVTRTYYLDSLAVQFTERP